jgi:rubrerythrin
MADQELARVVETAIKREEEAYDFYKEISAIATDKNAKQTTADMAEEEKKHKEFLLKYRDGGFGTEALRLTEVVKYNIAEHIEDPGVVKDMKSTDVYLVAAHRELASYNFYKELADIHPQGTVKELLYRMANEELKHKEKVEYLYSNAAFPQLAGG